MIHVPPRGPSPSPILIVGEAPGQYEASAGKPFWGPSGDEQSNYLKWCGIRPSQCRMTNLVPIFRPGNPDPCESDIAKYSSQLDKEIRRTKPLVILAVGRISTRYFLGSHPFLKMYDIHGTPCRGGVFDSSIAHRSRGAAVIPIIHPASALHATSSKDSGFDIRSAIQYDYKQAIDTYRALEPLSSSQRAEYISNLNTDEFDGIDKSYIDLTNSTQVDSAIKDLFRGLSLPDHVSVDTEGDLSSPWSIQVTTLPTISYIARCSNKETFDYFIYKLNYIFNNYKRPKLVLHNALHDIPILREMGLNVDNLLYQHRIIDTMYLAYILRVLPQSLKALMWRLCGMDVLTYESVVNQSTITEQLSYLSMIADARIKSLGKVEVILNDGQLVKYGPQPLSIKARKLLGSIKLSLANGDQVTASDIAEKWYDISGDAAAKKRLKWQMLKDLELQYGKLPIESLDVTPLDQSIFYAGKDADGTLRVLDKLLTLIEEHNINKGLIERGARILPMIEEMQRNGMPASYSYFYNLYDELTERAVSISRDISTNFLKNVPFNPNSPLQTAKLIEARGIEIIDTTPKGAPSTSKTSLEKYRLKDEAINLLFLAREHYHYRDTFCWPVIEALYDKDKGQDIHPVIGQIKCTRTATRRLSMEKTDRGPNLLAMPKRQREGMSEWLASSIRRGFVAPQGYKLTAHDVSQMELVVLAFLSQDPIMCDVFRNGGDIHATTAEMLFNVPPEEQVGKIHRIPAKTTNFLVVYGGGAMELHSQLVSKGIDISFEECVNIIDKFYSKYKGVRRYKEQVEREVRDRGYDETTYGFRRYFPHIVSRDKGIALSAAREAVSLRVQGTAQDMMQESMSWIWYEVERRRREYRDKNSNRDKPFDVKFCLQIHDEILALTNEDSWEDYDKLVIEGLTKRHGLEMNIPIKADGGYGDRWSEI